MPGRQPGVCKGDEAEGSEWLLQFCQEDEQQGSTVASVALSQIRNIQALERDYTGPFWRSVKMETILVCSN